MRLLFCILCWLIRAYLARRKPNGTRNLVAELISLKAQLIVIRRKNPHSARLSPFQRLVFALCSGLMTRQQLIRSSFTISPATILKFHSWLVNRKYRRLFSSPKGKAGRHSISNQLRQLILDIKTKNPSFGCPQIAAIIYDRTGITLSDETVRRTLMKFYRGTPGNGPSWLRARPKISGSILHPIFGSSLNALRSQNPQNSVGYSSGFVPSDRPNLTQTWAHKSPTYFGTGP